MFCFKKIPSAQLDSNPQTQDHEFIVLPTMRYQNFNSKVINQKKHYHHYTCTR
jgi:hypothetical protein